jgi:hypothetical protein
MSGGIEGLWWAADNSIGGEAAGGEVAVQQTQQNCCNSPTDSRYVSTSPSVSLILCDKNEKAYIYI